MSRPPHAACLRCGITNQVRWNTRNYECRDCKLNPLHDTTRGLPDGTWAPQPASGGVRRFIPSGTTRIGRPRKPPTYMWTLDTARHAHREYVKGNRTDWSREGERMYSRWAKSRQRSTREAA